MAKYQVIVGNIKTLHFNNKEAATQCYNENVANSKSGTGRAAWESVTLCQGSSAMVNILKEFNPSELMILLIDGNRGIYAQSEFILTQFGSALESTTLTWLEINELCMQVRDVENESANDAFEEICEKCFLMIDGVKYRIEQNGNIWAVPFNMPMLDMA